jgi:hypothetical protein
MAREKSILSAPRRRASNTSCNRSHTPAACQSRRRRQQVMPEPHPISLGRLSHGIPVVSTNRIPVNTGRADTACARNIVRAALWAAGLTVR